MTKKENKKNDHPVEKIFSKIGEKTGINKKKVDKWQSKWLAVPKNRTKYESLKDAPTVMGEEMFAITNDIVDFCKGEHGEQSHVFKAIKEEAGGFFKNPAAFLQQKAEEGKKKMMEIKKMAEKQAKETAKKAKK